MVLSRTSVSVLTVTNVCKPCGSGRQEDLSVVGCRLCAYQSVDSAQ